MPDPLNDIPPKPLMRKLRRLYGHAFIVMACETLTARGWRIITWILFFCGLWLLGAPQALGPAVSTGVFAVFLAGVCYFYHCDLRFLHWPRRAEIGRRLERESGLDHHPLASVEDTLANPHTDDSRTLWQTARDRAYKSLTFLKPARGRPVLASRDVYALRLGVLMFFGVTLLLAGPDWKARLWAGVTPFSFPAAGSPLEPVRVVITPPAYTALPQMIVSGNEEKPLDVPAGSSIKATVHSGWGRFARPELHVDSRVFSFTDAGNNDFTLEIAAPPGNTLQIKQAFFTRASWVYNYVSDRAPDISMAEAPDILPEGTLRFPVTISDDYGAKFLTLNLRLKDGQPIPPTGHPFTETRAVSSPRGKSIDIAPVYDLSAHSWAGLPVQITFSVEDELHQKTSTAPVDIILPERNFTNPLAQEIIALRHKLIQRPLDEYEGIQKELESIIAEPDRYKRDIIVLLALRSASSRLFWAGPSVDTAEGVIALLWDTALRLEDGNFSIAARALRQAQKDLAEALQDPSITNTEIARLMDNLRLALAQYFSELQQQIQKRMAQGQDIPVASSDMLASILTPEQLGAMLSQLESQILSGDRQSAQQMLAQLQQMMDSFNPSIQEMPEDMKAMMRGAKDIQNLIRRQQALLDNTLAFVNLDKETGEIPRGYGQAIPGDTELFNQWGAGDMPPAPGSTPEKSPADSLKSKAAEQESIRLQLGEIILKAGEFMPEIPQNMAQADFEMRESFVALINWKAAESIPHQQKAIEYLNESKQRMAKQFTERLQQMTGLAFGRGMKLDPLGRPYGEDGPGSLSPESSVKIPDEAQRKKAQDIMRLLQDRAGEFQRPEPELEYYRRLLRQF